MAKDKKIKKTRSGETKPSHEDMHSVSSSKNGSATKRIDDGAANNPPRLRDRPMKTVDSNALPEVSRELIGHASVFLFVAALVGIALGFAKFGLEGGHQGVPAIGGMLDAQIPVGSANIIFALDTLFPMFLGSGFVLLATGLQSRGNPAMVRILLTVVAVAVLSDFVENSMVYKSLIGEGTNSMRWMFTVLKFAGLGFAGILLFIDSATGGAPGTSSYRLTRYVFPVSVAVLLSGIGGETVRDFVSAGFAIILVVLAFMHITCRRDRHEPSGIPRRACSKLSGRTNWDKPGGRRCFGNGIQSA